MGFLEENDRWGVREYAVRCARRTGLDAGEHERLARAGAARVSGRSDPGADPIADLQGRWYRSLEAGAPDYGIYDDPVYLADLWGCWLVYSRAYIRALARSEVVGPLIRGIESIADLGCGVGYSTAALYDTFAVDVVGTQLPGTIQWSIARDLADERHFGLLDSVEEVGRVDMVFASEYFEHFEQPIQHLTEVWEACKPRLLVVANAFGAKAIGHFDQYKIFDSRVNGAGVGRLFNAALRRFGYEQVETGFWNRRPAVWVRK